MKAGFDKFRSVCRYAGLAYDDPDDHTVLSTVCKLKVPSGKSWGKCDEAHCPYFGMEIRNIKMYQNDELIGTAETGRVVLE